MKTIAVAALAALSFSAHAQILLKVHSFSGPQAPDQARHLFPWAEKINQEAGGKMKVEVYTNMQLGGKPADPAGVVPSPPAGSSVVTALQRPPAGSSTARKSSVHSLRERGGRCS